MTTVTIYNSRKAARCHVFFSLPNHRYYEFSLANGLKMGWLHERDMSDVTNITKIQSNLTISEIESSAMNAARRGYNYFINNCRTFVREALSGQRTLDLLAVGSGIAAVALMVVLSK